MIAKFVKTTPYISQHNTPKVNKLYIPKDSDEVSLVLMIIMACGKNEEVVKVAAI